VALRILLLILLLAALDAEANGGRLRLAREPAGPYLVSVWTDPDPPRLGRLDVSVAVMRPPDGDPVLDAEVRLRARPPGDRETPPPVTLRRGAGGNLLLHHGEVELLTDGRSALTVEVVGPAGRGAVTFSIDVLPRQGSAWVVAAIGLLMTLVVGFVLFSRRSRSRQGRAFR
jgi:hypothetical protein